jgi:hypothetical protein
LQITCQERGKHDAASETTVARKGSSGKKVSATAAVKDKRAGKPVKTCEDGLTPAADK